MQIHIVSVGRLKSGSERLLISDYADRFNKIGTRLGFRPINEIEVVSGNIESESRLLVSKTPEGSLIIRLDENGKSYSSIEFSELLAKLRDSGKSDLTFLIGGALGFGGVVKEFAPNSMSFGRATWPHRLVRVMLVEQLYRAGTILLGTPYHKS